MKKTLKLCVGLGTSALVLLLAGAVDAQTATGPATTQTKSDLTPPPPPPRLEVLEEGPPEADVKAGKAEPRNQTKEIRDNTGKVTEVQVQSGGSHYVLKADPEIGNAPKGTAQGINNRPAQWTIFQFGGKKENKESEPLPVLPPAPAQAASARATDK